MSVLVRIRGVHRSSVGQFAAVNRLPVADRLALIAAVVTACLVAAAPVLAPHDPVVPAGPTLTPPGAEFLMGTDEIGFDVLSRVLHGAQLSLVGALIVTVSGVIIGGLIGLVAGARGGRVDAGLMRLTDLFLALPAPVLAIAIVAYLGPSFEHTLLGVAIVWWPLYARVTRGEVRALAARPHVEAARLAGISSARLWLRHLLPGAVPPVLVAATLDIGLLVLTLAGLSYLGLGALQPAPELGAMSARGLPYLLSKWWVPIFPALAVFILAFVASLAGDALRDLMDEP